ncbi:histidine kinase-like ATPase, partial [Cunninghamella echinulata]
RNASARPNFSSIGNRIKRIDPNLFHSDNVVDNMAILLEKYANNMEKLVRKRTEHLVVRTKELELERARTQKLLKDLSAAKEVAEAAAASKQNFLANMSHEIRTPMNAVIGMSRMLMESNLPPDLYECAETIESSGNHLVALIDDILDYSKIESGRLTLERSQLDLTFVIESAIKLLSSNYLGKGIALLYFIDPDLPIHVYGDLVRLRQIILNLLSNAFKFTEKGSVTITTPSSDTDCSPLENSTFLFSIADTGIGIPKSKQKKLFKSFSQVDTSTTRNYGGTGLGLAISRQLVRLMSGDMWVESEEGEGSTFYFRVKLSTQPNSPTYGEQFKLNDLGKYNTRPLKTINSASTSLAATPLGTPLIARQQQHNYNFSEVLGSVRALLVDDNPINRKVLAKMLSRIGLTCDIAHNGKEALDKWIESKKQGQPIELLLMDICMPVMNGLEVATRIREESTATFPYIIALTACVMNGDKEKCFESGTFFKIKIKKREKKKEKYLHKIENNNNNNNNIFVFLF